MDEGRKRFFFEKKKQKTSVHWYPAKPTWLQVENFFASFLQKRSASLL
jgi:hypothetical protein